VELKYWSCLHFRFLCSLSLIPVCLSYFYSTLLTSSGLKKISIFVIEYFLGTPLIYKIEEEVISSEKLYEGSTVARALNKGLRIYPLIKNTHTNTH